MRIQGLAFGLCGWALLACECGAGGPGGSTSKPAPFTVVDVTPDARLVPVDGTFTVKFSMGLADGSATRDTVVLVPTDRLSNAFITDFGSPPLSASRVATLISAAVTQTGDSVTLTPNTPLPFNTSVSLLLSKKLKGGNGQELTVASGENAAFQIDYLTENTPPQIVETSLPSGTPSVVPTNLRVIQLTADQELEGAAASAVRVVGQGNAGNVDVESVEVVGDHKTVRITLKTGACQPLCPMADYSLEAGAPLTNVSGQALKPFAIALKALPSPDVDAPRLLFQPFIRTSEADATFTVVLNEPVAGSLRLSDPGQPSNATFIFRPSANCTGIGAAKQCPYRADITGLNLGPSLAGRAYEANLEFLDSYENGAVFGPFPLATVKLPLLSLTEVYNNPPAAQEGTQEFVEVMNISDQQTFDLQGLWAGTITLETGELIKSMELAAYVEGPTTLGPGQRAVIGGAKFDPRAVGAPEMGLVMIDAIRSHTTLMGGLSSSRDTRKAVALFLGNPALGAAIVSVYAAPAILYDPSSTFPEGVSAERVNPVSKDLDALWCHSVGAPTPGRTNSVEGLTACP